jgi:hypothetical protein
MTVGFFFMFLFSLLLCRVIKTILIMTVIDIDETTKAGQHRHPHIAYDANGVPTGYTVEEVFAEVDKNLSEAYGIDFAKVTRLVDSGELSEDEVTNELLLSPEFKYEPYPGFKPKPLPPDFKPDPDLLAAISDL